MGILHSENISSITRCGGILSLLPRTDPLLTNSIWIHGMTNFEGVNIPGILLSIYAYLTRKKGASAVTCPPLSVMF